MAPMRRAGCHSVIATQEPSMVRSRMVSSPTKYSPGCRKTSMGL
ncbi:hypothetical protein QRO08_06630 [Paracidovorax citrulli]|uniref:Uncharacterized protein n=1 Tax=Paracidovorax citrulli TaxID=80869 RepID=A0ABY9ATY2_PARCI|nr:hypothetical protein [Paracidovorax citrulli]WIY30687.1 hypothetical protein QRO09_02860 [Paracidovorax citrulli]WIY39896.1 hypothetical protein QRO10_02795 [Paracidovorax citrulli]WIY42868.1 hypothetical protein QRO12_18240 [Paracidovorax citrulli]WIY50242.1 hypothetical protein QRO08_06630 [Paracidovorax citrulli]